MSEEEPDFGANAGEGNEWGYLQCKDLEDSSTVNGSTGFVFDQAEIKHAEVNTNVIRWICIEVTSHTAGRLTATLIAR